MKLMNALFVFFFEWNESLGNKILGNDLKKLQKKLN